MLGEIGFESAVVVPYLLDDGDILPRIDFSDTPTRRIHESRARAKRGTLSVERNHLRVRGCVYTNV